MSYFGGVYAENLPHRAKSVYMYLRDRANRDGECWPCIRTIAADLRLSRRTVQRALSDLTAAGILTRSGRFRDNGSQTSNMYLLSEK